MPSEYLQKLLSYRGEIYQERFDIGTLRIENPNLKSVYLRDEDLGVGGLIDQFECIHCSEPYKELHLYCDMATVYLAIVAFHDPFLDILLITHLTREEFQHWPETEHDVKSRVNGALKAQFFRDAFSSLGSCAKCLHPLKQLGVLSFADFHNQGGTIITWDIFSK